MVYKKKGSHFSSDNPSDGTYSLNYRLSLLWLKTQIAYEHKEWEKVDIFLDLIFQNLLFKEQLDIEEDDSGKIVDVKLNDKDMRVWEYLNKKIKDAKDKIRKGRLTKNRIIYEDGVEDFIKALKIKDAGLRKYQHNSLKTYTKEYERNPARAMWGG